MSPLRTLVKCFRDIPETLHLEPDQLLHQRMRLPSYKLPVTSLTSIGCQTMQSRLEVAHAAGEVMFFSSIDSHQAWLSTAKTDDKSDS